MLICNITLRYKYFHVEMQLFCKYFLLLAIKSKLPPFLAGISSSPKSKVQSLNLGFSENFFLEVPGCTEKKKKRWEVHSSLSLFFISVNCWRSCLRAIHQTTQRLRKGFQFPYYTKEYAEK